MDAAAAGPGGAERYTKAFPSETNAVAVVVQADDVRRGEVGAAIARLTRQAEASDTLLDGSEVTVSKDGTVAKVVIPTCGNGTDEESMDALAEVREELVPTSVGAVGSATVLITGSAAQTSDFSGLLGDRMPLVFAFVLGLAFLLMLVLPLGRHPA